VKGGVGIASSKSGSRKWALVYFFGPVFGLPFTPSQVVLGKRASKNVTKWAAVSGCGLVREQNRWVE
jgi:hypothetical protein